MKTESVFRSAIKGSDGEVDAGYLSLFWTMAATVSSVPIIVIAGAVSAFGHPEQAGAILQGTGVAIGAVCTGAGVVIGAVGAFRLGDTKHAPPTMTTTTITGAGAAGATTATSGDIPR